MKITIVEQGEVTVMALEGNIMQEDVSMMRNRLEDLIQSGRTRVVLDLAGVSYLSSMCLAVMVGAKNQLAARKGDLKLSSVNDLIRNLFEMTQLIRKVEIFETPEDAIGSWK